MLSQDAQGFSLLEHLLAIVLLGILAGSISLQLAPLLNRTSLDNGGDRLCQTFSWFACRPLLGIVACA
jgi:prepilin-type N-terminal cleavage/methylation domain-containing protein